MGQKKHTSNRKRTEEREARRSMTPQQIRARARRQAEKGDVRLSEREKKVLMGNKPIEDWDLEELARGRPRDKRGNFSGTRPSWITREIHEMSIAKFKEAVRTDMQSVTVRALEVLRDVLDNEDVDDRGKPIVAAGVKVDTAKFLLEHLIGKPTQPVEADISIKLQGILGNVLVQPAELTSGDYTQSASHRIIEAEVMDDDDVA